MTVTVLLFGPQATLAGVRELAVRVDDEPATADAVLAALRDAEPRLGPSLAASRLAVNHAFVAPDQTIAPTDEVALIGMVSGG